MNDGLLAMNVYDTWRRTSKKCVNMYRYEVRLSLREIKSTEVLKRSESHQHDGSVHRVSRLVSHPRLLSSVVLGCVLDSDFVLF